jgi:hypothetical protein
MGVVHERDHDQDADERLQNEVEIGRPCEDQSELNEAAWRGSR